MGTNQELASGNLLLLSGSYSLEFDDQVMNMVVPMFSTEWLTGPLKKTSPEARSAIFVDPSANMNLALYGLNT